MKRILVWGFVLGMASLGFSKDMLVHWNGFVRNDLRSQPFEVSSRQTFDIEVVGPRIHHREEASFVWILDLETRKPVWELEDAHSSRYSDNRRLEQYDDSVTLDKGKYQIFFAPTRSYWSSDGFRFKFRDLINLAVDGHMKDRDYRDFELRFYGDAELFQDTDYLFDKMGDRSLVRLNRMERDRYEQVGLHVEKKTDVLIYAVGEITRDGNYDAAWIQNVDTGKKVWTMDHFETDYAGGNPKNRMFRDVITLDKGNYILTSFSDDSHNYGDWNAIPPYDPDAWGISIFVDKRAKIETYDVSEKTKQNQILQMTMMGDNEYVHEGFTLNHDADIRVLAMGEGHRREDLVDYGWIINVDNHKRVWDMNERRTEHAGGTTKNRMIDEVIHLPAGSYKVYYVTDDSHSYQGGWNASKPINAKMWGITLYGVDDFNMDWVGQYQDPDDSDVLVRMVHMRNDQREHQSFTLDDAGYVRIYALGEGFPDEMADYGWIVDADSGRIVWRMEYEDTDPAGGAQKNRVYDGELFLEKGKYRVYYETDDSHAFHHWNSRPPRDQDNWGISIYKGQK